VPRTLSGEISTQNYAIYFLKLLKTSLKYGTPVRRQGDTLEYRLHKKDKERIIKHLKQLIQSIDKCTGKAVLVDSDMEEIVTVYNLM